MTTYKEIINNGVFSCDEIKIAKAEWKKILKSVSTTTFDVLVDFVRMEEHKASCEWASITNGKPANTYLMCINKLGEKVSKQFDFQVINTSKENVYWIIPMKAGWKDKKSNNFVWQLRDELVQAVQELLAEQLIQNYIDFVSSKGSLKECNELYKWQLIADCKNLNIVEMAQKVGVSNLVDTPRAGATLRTLAKEQGEILQLILRELFNEEIDLGTRLVEYKTAFSFYWEKDEYGVNKPNDERSASALLSCKNPQEYTFYKSEVYELFCKYIGESICNVGKKYIHFLDLLKRHILPYLHGQKEFMQKLYAETDSCVHSDLLNAQDVLWQMQDYMKKNVDNKAYWMGGYNWGGSNDRSEEFFNRGVWEGSSDRANVMTLIKNIKPDDVILLKSAYTKGSDHKTSAIKVIGVGKVQSKPELIDNKFYRVNVAYRRISPVEFTDFKGSYLSTFHKVADPLFIEFADKILSASPNIISDTMEYKSPSVKVKSIMELLDNAGQIILQGAPGCGKTYITTELAVALCDKQIPVKRENLKKRYRELQKEGRIAFTTFHQSLDYEDFVEGLKPDTESASDEMKFIVKPGIFKRICEAAKSKETSNFDEVYSAFVNDFDSDEVKVITTSSGAKFGVSVNSQGNLSLFTGANLQHNGVLTKEKIEHHLENKYWRTYYTGVYEYLKVNYNLSESDKPEGLPYVLIIDEINRANISKVLGELITLIEKSKRLGAEDEVTATLPYSGDVFGVPQNLFIIGTMNTADRSVGYIDYAIRRRFAFKTLKNDATAIRDFYGSELHNDLYDKEINLLTSVRNLIKDNLNRDFKLDDIMVGHSYFMAKTSDDYQMNLDYKIKPLLEEYLRDGILVEKGGEIAKAINDLK